MIVQDILPWQQDAWEKLQWAREQNKIPHALLLTGLPGLGKNRFAKQFLKSLLCLSPRESGLPCATCRSCDYFEAGTHPDYLALVPEEDSAVIKIDQVREAILHLNHTAAVSAYKGILISPADGLNDHAVNALLKTLEEPAGNTVIALITAQPLTLSATLRSRCQVLPFVLPSEADALTWLESEVVSNIDLSLLLKLAQGSPLRALHFIENEEWVVRKRLLNTWYEYTQGKLSLSQIASEYLKEDFKTVLFHWLTWTQDLIFIQQQSQAHIQNTDCLELFQNLSNRFALDDLHRFYQELKKAELHSRSKIALNPQLILERLLILWAQVAMKEGQTC